MGSLFMSNFSVEDARSGTATVKVNRSAVFSTWISLKRLISRQEAKNVVIDLSGTKFVDHRVRANKNALQKEFVDGDRELSIIGIDGHRPLSDHPLAALKA